MPIPFLPALSSIYIFFWIDLRLLELEEVSSLSLSVLAAGHTQDAQQQRLHPVPSSVLGMPTNPCHPAWGSSLLRRAPRTKRCLGFTS